MLEQTYPMPYAALSSVGRLGRRVNHHAVRTVELDGEYIARQDLPGIDGVKASPQQYRDRIRHRVRASSTPANGLTCLRSCIRSDRSTRASNSVGNGRSQEIAPRFAYRG